MTETYWDCIFVKPNGTIKRGAIPQERGIALAEAIKQKQRRMGRNRKRVTILIHNTLDNVPFEIIDLYFVEFEREVV